MDNSSLIARMHRFILGAPRVSREVELRGPVALAACAALFVVLVAGGYYLIYRYQRRGSHPRGAAHRARAPLRGSCRMRTTYL